jgi:hypothetical protein
MNYFEFAGHFASVLTMAAYIVKDILWLRFLTVFACIAGISFNYFVPATPLWTVIYWNILFIIINCVQIAIIIKERQCVEFSEEEKELYETLFKSFAPFEFMKLLRLGKWVEAKKGQVLAVEQKPLDDVMLIYNGRVSVESREQALAELKDGSFIGEMSFIRGGAATATVRVIEPTRYLSWSKGDLRKLLHRNPSMKSAMQSVFSTDLTNKLMRRSSARKLK